MTIPIQTSLLESCQYLQDRVDVEECLNDLLVDVEWAVTLEERLQSSHEIERLQRRVDEQEVALAEARELRSHAVDQQTQLADALLEDLISLSDEIGRLKETKEKHEELLVQYDSTVAKLLETEERLQDEKQRRAKELAEREKADADRAKQERANESAARDVVEAKETPPKTIDQVTSPEGEEEEDKEVAQPDRTSESIETDETLVASNANGPEPVISEMPPAKIVEITTEKPAAEDAPVEPTTPVDDINQTQEGGTIEEEEAVVLLDDTGDDAPLRFDDLETEVLMKIFAFLDALDILNAAQISLRMYNRVDSLFGLGDESSRPAEDSSTIATTETPAAAAAPSLQPTVVALPPAKEKTAEPTSQPTVAALPEKKKAPTEQQQQQPKQQQQQQQRSMTPPRAVAANLFSMLQPRLLPTPKPAVPAVPTAKPVPPRPTTTNSSSSTAALPMNAAMANSMAAKLSDAELNAIIIMTERLKQKETLAAQLQQEKETLAATLEGTENVKQFLIAKVRDMEVTIAASVENEMKVAQQIVSDQEVIAFLDARVQELERETQALRAEQQASQDSLEKVQKQSSDKALVIGDMLQFEREKMKESEREWKATKKVLVKEVKSCRAQIASLQGERDSYKEQIERLQQESMSLHNHSNGTSHIR